MFDNIKNWSKKYENNCGMINNKHNQEEVHFRLKKNAIFDSVFTPEDNTQLYSTKSIKTKIIFRLKTDQTKIHFHRN